MLPGYAAAAAGHSLLPNCPDAVAVAAPADDALQQPQRLPAADDDALRYDGDSAQQPVWNSKRSSADGGRERERERD